MADSKLSALDPLVTEMTNTDEIYLNDGGISKRQTYGVFKSFFTRPGDNISTLTNNSGFTDDQTGPEIKAAYEGEADTNAYDDNAVSKLILIEPSADVTDEANVTAALNGATFIGVTVAAGDKVLLQDISDSDNIKTVTAQAIADLSGNGDALVANPLSQFAATTSLELKGVISDETGSGALVFATSPTLVTPALGTPSALVGTNITGTASGFTAGSVTTNANMTGHITSIGNAAILGSFTKSQLSAAVSDGTVLFTGDAGDALVANPLSQFAATTSLELKGVISDETGSGALVFATSPTLVTPALGTPSALVGTNITGTASGFTAGSVTTNANMIGVVTSAGNTTSIADKALAIAKLADGTDGELITWDATGVITTIPVGTSTHVLTSNGIGTVPTFQVVPTLDPAALNKVITGTTYTILEADNGYNLIFTNVAAIPVSLPDTLSTDFQCVIIQTTAAGIPTVTPNTDTINGAALGVAPIAQWKGMYLSQFVATEWLALL